jgi:hypothetical protein
MGFGEIGINGNLVQVHKFLWLLLKQDFNIPVEDACDDTGLNGLSMIFGITPKMNKI